MSTDEDIVAFMETRGPVLPADVARHIKTDILIASAYLSELASRRKVKISSLKVGGSPIYSLPGQEDKLEKFAQNLNEKDLRAYDLLKQKKVIRDSHMTPLMRVALRSIKDFSVPITVTFGDSQELFWKWHNISDAEVKSLIQREIEGEKPETVVPAPVVPAEPEIIQKKKKEKKEVKPKETLLEEKIEVKQVLPEKIEKKIEVKVPEERKLETKPKETGKETIESKKKKILDFEGQIYELFKEKGIKIINEEIIKKGAESNFVVDIPSSVGMLRYLCKARNKKSSTEKDLSSALVDGQLHKMPVLYVHIGKLNSKAQTLLKTEPFKTMVLFPLTDGSKTQKLSPAKANLY